MTAYRARLQRGDHPTVDTRRAEQLRAHLSRLASALTPRWDRTGGPDDFATALLAIAARLGEETTRRLDRTAERDALAFFDFLGLPPVPPHAATGVMALTLTDKAVGPVFAPAGTQLSVAGATPDDDQVVFESSQGLRIVQGRIADVIAVDPSADRIESAPAQVTALTASEDAPDVHTVMTASGVDSTILQLSPAAGLAVDDVLRIGTTAHRIAAVDANTGIVTLRDGLESAVVAGTTVRRVTTFPTFDLRDLQGHAFYIGHAELFDLKSPARITLALEPPRLARELAGLDVSYAMWGTEDGESDPDWIPVQLRRSTSGAVELVTTGTASVDETEVAGHRSRWLRAELAGPVTGRRALSSSVSAVGVTVASMAPTTTPTEGSATVARAFHNGNPLSTARRFYPFGPEPTRFDSFAFAAPEVLSKEGARAQVNITMVDASVTTFDVAAGTEATGARAYGVGSNGDLQVLSIGPDTALRWDSVTVTDGEGRRVALGGAAMVGIDTDLDLVVARDRTGGLRSARLKRSSTAAPTVEGTWTDLPAGSEPMAADPNGRQPGPVPAPAPTGSGATAVLFQVKAGLLQALPFDSTGVPVDRTTWFTVAVTGSASAADAPALTDSRQITPVQGPAWPLRPEGGDLEVVALDTAGALWLGVVVPNPPDRTPSVRWTRLTAAGEARPDVAPTATRFRTGDDTAASLWIAYAGTVPATGPARLRGLRRRPGEPDEHLSGPSDAVVDPGTSLHANPSVVGIDGPMTVGLGQGGAVLWLDEGTVLTVPPPSGPLSAKRPFLLGPGTGRSAEVVLCGDGERIFRAGVDFPVVAYELHDAVAHLGQVAPDWVQVDGTPAVVELGDHNRRIRAGNLRVYLADGLGLTDDTEVTFLRRSAAKGVTAFTGSAGPDPTSVRLDVRDTTTRSGSRLVIDGSAYAVTGVVAGVATLTTAVTAAAGPVAYRSARVARPTTAGTTGIATLVELPSVSRDVPALWFPGTGVPAPRTFRARQNGTPGWVLLAGRWSTTPPTEGTATIPVVPRRRVEWTENAVDRGYQNPELSWEYYDGEGWRRLADEFVDRTADLSVGGKVSFRVPDDLAPTEIGGATDLWIRARLIGGDYGRPVYVTETVTDSTDPQRETRTVTVDTSQMRPPEILTIEAGFGAVPVAAPDLLLVGDNLDVLDQTRAVTVPQARFDVFRGASAVTGDAGGRAVHVGLTGPTPAGTVSLLVDAVDQPGTETLAVDVRTPDGWHRAGVDDRTRALRRRGAVTVSLDEDPVAARLFGRERVWLRLRPDPAPASWAPEIRGLYLNTVAISQARTVGNEILGSSSGEPGLTVVLAQHPVLPETLELRVREDLGDEERAAVEAEQADAAPGSPPAVRPGPDQATGTWVLWRRVDSLLGSGPTDRVYVLDPASGRVTFGDGRRGRVPPVGRDGIRAFGYQQGGGPQGNVRAWSDARLTSAVEGVDTVVLPVDAAGGTGDLDPEPAARALLSIAPDRLRHADRALSPSDVEAIAVSSAVDVVRARCARPAGPRAPITVTLSVRGESRQPVPTLARREAVAALLREMGWGGVAEDGIVVAAPTYAHVAVTARLVAPRDLVAGVDQAARTALTDLFHPVDGGPDGDGWPFGRTPTTTDVLRALAGVDGLDRVESVELTAAGGGALAALPVDGQPYAEPADVTVFVTVAEEDP